VNLKSHWEQVLIRGLVKAIPIVSSVAVVGHLWKSREGFSFFGTPAVLAVPKVLRVAEVLFLFIELLILRLIVSELYRTGCTGIVYEVSFIPIKI
jgi:hypothetical protein